MAEKPASLAAKSGALTAESFKVPAIFQQPGEALEGRAMAPYVVFAHPNRSDEWKKLTAKFGKVDDGDTFLVEPDGITQLPNFRASIVKYRKYYCAKDNAGNVTQTSEKETPVCKNEHVEAVLFLFLEDRCIPANAQFRTTKCGAAVELSQVLAKATKPEWAAESQAHKESLICPLPWMRFYGEISVKPPRTPKAGGRPYRTCTVDAVRPTTANEWRLIKQFGDDPKSQQLLELAAARFQSQMADIDKKLVKAA